MDAQFWNSVWKEGRINFHQSDFHPKLIKHFPRFEGNVGKTILVPLCGKTKDMVWLAGRGMSVIGVELVESAVQAFFDEIVLETPKITEKNEFKVYSGGPFQLFSGDFFRFSTDQSIDFVYDRAAMVALPPEMRPQYVETIKRSLASSGQILLLTFEYADQDTDGPPFSVKEDEIVRLYGPEFLVEVLERDILTEEHPRLMAVPGIRHAVYAISRRP